jgi:hypothetical protein
MAKGIMIALTNPTTAQRDEEFNRWYNETHAREVTSLPGIASITRYRAHQQILPAGEEPAYRYLAIYELDDVDVALRSLAEGAEKFDMSESLDFSRSLGIAFTKIFPVGE